MLDSRGLGVSNQKIIINGTLNKLQVTDIQAMTDDTGKAIFDTTSNISGTYEIYASTQTQKLPQQVKINFN